VLRLSAILLSVVMLGGSSMSFQTQNGVAEALDPQLIEVPAFTVIGLSVRTTNAVEMSGDAGKIGPLWSQFMHGGAEAIPGVIEQGTVYAVYTHYESDETGAYDLILGKSVQPEQQVPVNMKAIQIPAARYLVFSVAGSSPDAIKASWMSVYRYFADHSDQRRAFTFDFEQHSRMGIKIFIAVH
jgi:predicted transcriptional regulator YdeE